MSSEILISKATVTADDRQNFTKPEFNNQSPNTVTSEAKTGLNLNDLPLPDPRVLWGRALLAIKKANKIMLHTVCVGLGKFELKGNTLFVSVPSQLDYEMLRKPQNCGDLVESLRNLGYNVNIEFVLDSSARDIRESKISRLQKILGADIQVIN